MKTVIILILSLFLLSSCKKETLFVTVKNAVTGEPLANNVISIVEETNFKDGAGSKTNDFYSGLTNADGILQITKKFNKNYSYYVYLGKFSEEVCYVNTGQYLWAVGDETQLDFLYAPCAYLKLKIENVSCTGASDNFKLYYLGRQVGGQGDNIIGAEMRNENGCYYYEASSFSDVPMGDRYYKWEVTKNGITTTYYDTITLSAGEYRTYVIDY